MNCPGASNTVVSGGGYELTGVGSPGSASDFKIDASVPGGPGSWVVSGHSPTDTPQPQGQTLQAWSVYSSPP